MCEQAFSVVNQRKNKNSNRLKPLNELVISKSSNIPRFDLITDGAVVKNNITSELSVLFHSKMIVF